MKTNYCVIHPGMSWDMSV